MRQSLRFSVFQRDGFRCRYCGRSPDQGAVLQADHIHPKAKGGEDVIHNLITACWDCNIGKGTKVLRPVPRRGRRPRLPSVPPFIEPEPDPVPEWGAHCSTPLKIAAIGRQMGCSSYPASWRYMKSLPLKQDMPPLRESDYGWFKIVQRDRTAHGLLIQALGEAMSA